MNPSLSSKWFRRPARWLRFVWLFALLSFPFPAVPQEPSVTLLRANRNSGAQLLIVGPEDATSIADVSTNLTAWKPIATNVLAGGSNLVKSAFSTGRSTFFRARVSTVPREASVVLESPPLTNGMQFRITDVESRAVPTNRLGTAGYRPVQSIPGIATAWYMYYLVTDPLLSGGATPGVRLSLTFFDEGSGAIVVVYDSSDPNFRLQAGVPTGVWKRAGQINLTGSRTWRTESLVITDALFTKRCNGADIRLEINAAAAPTIHSVQLRQYRKPALRWRLASPLALPFPEPVVIGATVRDYGAVGDGVADDTTAFRDALNALKAAGGGTLFAPAGRYAIRENLTIPTGVTLLGEWERPGNGPVRGTILQAYQGRGNATNNPFLQLEASSGVVGLTVWHPEQSADAPAAYPPAIRILGGDSATVRNVTLVNAWTGLVVGPENNELHLVRGFHATALALGISLDFTTDIGRLEDVELSPTVWERSGLPGAPAAGGPHAAFMRAQGVGMRCFRSDWEYVSFVRIAGYRLGLELATGSRGAGNGQFCGVTVTDCDIGLSALGASEPGYLFTACRFATAGPTADAPLRTDAAFSGLLEFHSCRFEGLTDAARLEGTGTSVLLFHGSEFNGTVTRPAGYLSLLESRFSSPGPGGTPHLVLGAQLEAVAAAGNMFAEPKRVLDDSGLNALGMLESQPHPSSIPTVSPPPDLPGVRVAPRLFVVTEAPFLAPRDRTTDATPALAAALEAAAAAGGGIVFVPAGEYAVQGSLVVPSGVELRGALTEMPHHTVGRGSVLRALGGRGVAAGAPVIALSPRSGVRGLTVLHPAQVFGALVPYPWVIQGRGEDVHIINVTAVNPWRFIDLATHRCDRHFVDYAAGAPLVEGLRAGGGSTGGLVRDIQFNPHYWSRSPYSENALRPTDDLWAWQGAHLDPLVFGDWRGEQHGNFVFGSATGLRLMAENGRGPSGFALGHGTDGSPVAVTAEATGEGGFHLINAQLVSMQFPDRAYLRVGAGADLKLHNAAFWGSPGLSVRQDGGALELELAAFTQFGQFQFTAGSGLLANVWLGNRWGSTEDVSIGTANVATRGVMSPIGLRVRGGPIDAVANASRDPAPLAGAAEIAVTLTRRQVRDGLALREGDVESLNRPVTIGGREAWQGTKTILPGFQAYYMYFDVTHPEFVDGGAPGGEVTIEYYDAASGNLRLVYDSSDPNVKESATAPGAWKQAGIVALKGGGVWRTWTVRINDALFAGRCNGMDFRIEISGATPPAIGAFRYRRL